MLTFLPGALTYLRARLGGQLGREQGVTAVEYALMVAIIAILLVAGFYALFQSVDSRYREVGDCVATAPEDCAPADGG